MAGKHGMSYSSNPNMAARNAHRKSADQFRTYDTTPIRPKKSKGPIIFAIILILALIGGAAFVLKGCIGYGPYTEVAEGESITVVIPEGAYAGEIGGILQDSMVIGNANEFVDKVTKAGQENSLKPGTYVLVGGTPIKDLIDRLVAGPDTKTVTVPEGSTMKDVAKIVQSATDGQIKSKAFLKRCNSADEYAEDYPFVEGAYKNKLEGFLFPKTYSVGIDDDADSLVRMMLDQYDYEVSQLDFSVPEKEGLSQNDALILASIVERESSGDASYKVASVFYNRLDIGMALQSDATTAYEVGGQPTPEDLQRDSAYNTYKNPGLTPGPICNPGLDAFKAVCNPADTDYLYCYCSPNGEWHFNKSFEAHQDDIAKDLK